MHRNTALTPWIVLFALALATVSAGIAGEETARPGDVQVTIQLVNEPRDGERSVRTYQLVVPPDESRVRMNQGFRVPIPTTSFNTQNQEDGQVVPVTSFSYQNVGVSATLEAELLPGDRIHLRGSVEDSSVSSREPQSGRPIIATVNQTVDVTITDGATVRVGQLESGQFGTMYLEITAEIMD